MSPLSMDEISLPVQRVQMAKNESMLASAQPLVLL